MVHGGLRPFPTVPHWAAGAAGATEVRLLLWSFSADSALCTGAAAHDVLPRLQDVGGPGLSSREVQGPPRDVDAQPVDGVGALHLVWSLGDVVGHLLDCKAVSGLVEGGGPLPEVVEGGNGTEDDALTPLIMRRSVSFFAMPWFRSPPFSSVRKVIMISWRPFCMLIVSASLN